MTVKTLQITAAMACSLDGRLQYPPPDHTRALGSDADKKHLRQLRDGADAVLFGGQTFRDYPHPHWGEDRYSQRSGQLPLHLILTRGQNLLQDLAPSASLFESDALIWIITPEQVPDSLTAHYPERVQWVTLPSPQGLAQALPELMERLTDHGIQTLLLEGGGTLLHAMLSARLLHDLYLTHCPLMIGGTPEQRPAGVLSGPAFGPDSLERATLVSYQPLGPNELLSHWRFQRPKY